MNQGTYKVLAIRDSELRVSRHGISSTQGGQIEAVEKFNYPETTFWLAHEMMTDWYPGCRIQIVTPKWWQD